MTPEEVSALSDTDALRAYAWVRDNRPQAARTLSRMHDPAFSVSHHEIALAGEAMLACPPVVVLRSAYPRPPEEVEPS